MIVEYFFFFCAVASGNSYKTTTLTEFSEGSSAFNKEYKNCSTAQFLIKICS